MYFNYYGQVIGKESKAVMDRRMLSRLQGHMLAVGKSCLTLCFEHQDKLSPVNTTLRRLSAVSQCSGKHVAKQSMSIPVHICLFILTFYC